MGGIGFRNIHDFNKAMLAKQAWRLVSNPSSLCSRIFKARYYPNSDFFEACLGHNPSYAWRSILASKDLIIAGDRRRIGNGRDTKIWGSPWLMDKNQPCVQTTMPEDVEGVTVDALFVPGQLIWDVELVESLFDSRDSNEILAIPIPQTDRCDRWSWAGTSKGMYSVKSGYNFINSMSQVILGPAKTDWLFVWSLKVPPKIRNFVWRALKNILPTRSVLISRNMDVISDCKLCNGAAETAVHCLVFCPVVQKVWLASELGLRVGSADSMVGWWNAMKRCCFKREMEYAAAITWSNWQNRNELIWEGSSKPPSVVINRAGTLLADWQSVNVLPNQGAYIPESAPRKWTKPAQGKAKCNVDASILREPSGMGFGGVVRGANGEFIAAIHGSYPGNFSPLVAEAVGIREVLSWIKSCDFGPITVESDSKLLVDALKSNVEDESSVGIIVDDCKALLRAIPNCSVCFIFRSANSAAHNLAKAVNSMTGRTVWDNVCPPFITDVLFADLV